MHTCQLCAEVTSRLKHKCCLAIVPLKQHEVFSQSDVPGAPVLKCHQWAAMPSLYAQQSTKACVSTCNLQPHKELSELQACIELSTWTIDATKFLSRGTMSDAVLPCTLSDHAHGKRLQNTDSLPDALLRPALACPSGSMPLRQLPKHGQHVAAAGHCTRTRRSPHTLCPSCHLG